MWIAKCYCKMSKFVGASLSPPTPPTPTSNSAITSVFLIPFQTQGSRLALRKCWELEF